MDKPYNTSGGCTMISTSSKLVLQSPAFGAPLIAGRNVTFEVNCLQPYAQTGDACRSTFVFDLVSASGTSVRISSYSPGLRYDDGLGGCYNGCRWDDRSTALIPETLASGNYTLRATRTINWCPGSSGWCDRCSGHHRRHVAATAANHHH
jgi:hypothetical protein